MPACACHLCSLSIEHHPFAAGKDDVGEGSERAALYQHLLVEFALTLLQGALKKGIINPRAPGAGECRGTQPAQLLGRQHAAMYPFPKRIFSEIASAPSKAAD
jgi:hypothetical protein